MANQNQFPIGNSGSLEDCHTNIYAMTDIAGIQYLKFIPSKETYVNSLDDPILVMYTKCLNAGILSSWNRVRRDEKSNINDIFGFIRELWVFWYDGNEPFTSKNISVPSSIKEVEKGNWKNGLTYEIRAILFKALHTNFERYFLSRGFLRMGQWLQMPVKPHKHSKHAESQYGFNFKFFLHGESTICGAVDVRNLSPIRQIVPRDYIESHNHHKAAVILSPFATRAHLTGRYFRDDDPSIRQLWDEWGRYFPLSINQKSIDPNVPKFLEIVCGNFKMQYPSSLICVNIENSNHNTSKNHNKPNNRKRRFAQLDIPDGNRFSFVSRRLSDRILKETMIPLTNKSSKQKSTKPWRYNNSFCHSNCTCNRSSSFSSSYGDKSIELDNSNQSNNNSHNNNNTFHRRLLNREIPYCLINNSNNCNNNNNNLKFIPGLKIDTCCDRSISPVNNNTNNINNISGNSNNQPIIINSTSDPIMPTLSPQLPSNTEHNHHQHPHHQQQQHLLITNCNNNNSCNNTSHNNTKQIDPVPIQNNNITTNNNQQQSGGMIENNSNINKISAATVVARSMMLSTRTPPPPSITPSSLSHSQSQSHTNANTNAHSVSTEQTSAVGKLSSVSLSSDSNNNNLNGDNRRKSVDSLPFGIQINEKPILSTSTVTSINVINKSLLLHRKPVHMTQPCDNISDITLFPSLANNLQLNDDICSMNTNQNSDDPSVNYELKSESVYQDALINNRWLSFRSCESASTDGSPVAKKLKQLIIHNRNASSSNFCNPVIMEIPSKNLDCSTNTTKSINNSGKNYNNYTSMTNEKTEQISVIPDQIFEDSDEEDNSKLEAVTKTEMQLSSFYGGFSNNSDKILSPNNSQFKIFKSTPFGKFPGTSLHSSAGSGCLNAIELSLMYPTPPSLEGALTSVGSPAERQSNQQILNSNIRNSEYNHTEYILNSLSMSCQNWDEMDRDWSLSMANSSLFSSGVKYSKHPEPFPKENIPISFNHKRLHHQRNRIKRQIIDNEHKLMDRYVMTMNNMLNNTTRRNLIPTSFYPQMPFTNPSYNASQAQSNYSVNRLFSINSQRFPVNSGQNSAPMTPASVCTNPPSVESSIGTPRNIDHLNPNSSGFSRPQAVQSSPVIVKSPRTQSHINPLSSISSLHNAYNFLNYTTVNGLYFNVLLSDSVLNIYKDHNFDSCNICVCGMSVLGNDVGLYIDEYQQNLQPNSLNRSISNDDMTGSCTSKTDCKCGFSAVMNRHYAINANLFYEDEVEITGIRKPHVYTSQGHMIKENQEIVGKHMSLQLMSVYNEFGLSFLLDFIRFKNNVTKEQPQENDIEIQDLNDAVKRALEQAIEANDVPNNRIIGPEKGKYWLSDLYYSKEKAVIPKNYNDQIKLLMTLRPLLQDAVSNTRLLESSYTVDGPLTWKTFHRLAGRGNVESCEPQPLPRFQVFMGKHSSKDILNTNSGIPGLPSVPESNAYVSPIIHSQYSTVNNGFISGLNNFNGQPYKKSNNLSYFSTEGNPLCLSDGYPDKEKECLTISPYAVREWDKLNLEPIFRSKEIAYAIVTPTDSGKLLQNSLITYFKELNHTFEACRLGHHFSYRCNGGKDDIHSSLIEINTEDINEKGYNSSEKHVLHTESLQKYWIKELSQTMSLSNAEEFISKLLWYVKCCEHQTITLLSQHGVNKRNGTKSALFSSCDTQKRDNMNINQSLDVLFSPGNGCGSLSRGLNTKIWSSDKDVYLIVYLINPFIHGQDISDAAYRLSMQRMNKLCDRINDGFPESWKSRITFQILSMSKVFDAIQFGPKTGVGDGDGSSIGGRDSSATSSFSCTSSSVSWSVKWSRQWNWKSTAFSVYNSVRRKITRVSGLQSVFSGKNSSSNLCSSAKCSMARGCSSDDECESSASLINANRCLTKCGPTGYNENLTADYIKKIFFESQDQSNLERTYFSIYAPLYILAPIRNITYQVNNSCPSNHLSASASESWGYVGDKSNVLFVSYCLSVDQRWLLATCTDQLGTLLRQIQINIMVPQLHLRRNASPRRIGLGKLWDFIQEVISDSCQPWRLVIGRMGRAGHGELKGWNGLLSRQNLIRANQRFRDLCPMCHVWYTNAQQTHGVGSGGTGGMGSIGRCDMCAIQAPAIISGCFVSLECHSSFRIFPGSVKPEERASSNLQLCTPRDISVTHILVFPTSTSAGADQDLSGGGGMVNEMNLEELLDLKFGNEGLEELGNISNMDMSDSGFPSGFDSYAGIGGLNQLLPQNSSSNQHDLISMGGLDPSMSNCLDHGFQHQFSNQEEGHMLMQQPLAMGYYLSTTDPGPLPSWFWSSCPPLGSTENRLPSCFKASLHLQTSLIIQEDGSSGLSGNPGSAPHPLDSHQTCDVLRFVLEAYHSLSWLTFDPSINDRRSCLPIHLLCLAQLYQADQSFM